MDTMAERWALLQKGVTVYGPEDDLPRPAVVLFHGCGGLRPHVHLYAQAAATTGVRAYVVDSFAPRGWDRNFAISLVCTGVVMQGYERSGDVLATLWGLKQSGRVQMDRVMLAGFSHGGWSIMDLMTQRLTRPGEAKLADPDPALVENVRALFLVYPYINFPARTNIRSWVRQPETFVVLAEKDHLTPFAHSRKIFNRLQGAGGSIETLALTATHAFDEEDFKRGVMSYSPEAAQASINAMLKLIDAKLF